MRLFIQIPCYNEEESLPHTFAELPRSISGVDEILWLVVDDGSTDRTGQVATELGADHVVRHPTNLGLARTFMTGVNACLRLGADIIVNTDADNQYAATDIPALIQPILDGRAEIVVGARPIDEIKEFSALKKLLQKLGSWAVRRASHTQIPDAPSGFRAFSREAAKKLNVFGEYTYTLETIIQAGQKGIAITSVPVTTNRKLRSSRLIKSVPAYLFQSISTIVRIFMTYRPLRFYFLLGCVPVSVGAALGARFLFYYLSNGGSGKIQSLILAAVLLGAGFLLWVAGLLADLIAVNRTLMEKIDWRLCQVEEALGEPASTETGSAASSSRATESVRARL